MDDDILFEELIELSHAQRVEKMGWCICEGTNGEGQLADDCPRECDVCEAKDGEPHCNCGNCDCGKEEK